MQSWILYSLQGSGMGVAGVAWATVIAQVLSALLSLAAIMKEKELIRFTREFLRIRMGMLKQTLKVGIPSAVQMTIAGFSWLLVTFLINRYGTDVSAGNGVAIKIKDLCQLLISAMSTGAVSVIAQNLWRRTLRQGQRSHVYGNEDGCCGEFGYDSDSGICRTVAGRYFTDDRTVIAGAVLNMRIEIIGQIFYAIFMIYHSMMIGAGHSTFAMMSSFTNCIIFRVILAITFEKIWGWRGFISHAQ